MCKYLPETPTKSIFGFPQVTKQDSTDVALEHLSILLQREASHYCDHLTSMEEVNRRVNESWRRRLAEWSFEVADYFDYDRDVVFYAFNFLDRVVAHIKESSPTPIKEKDFQALFVTCLYLAIKLHGEKGSDVLNERHGRSHPLPITFFVELSQHLFDAEHLKALECFVLSTLDWYVHPPTAIGFLNAMIQLFPDSPQRPKLFELARFLTELSVCVATMSVQYTPSVIAYATLVCALDGGRDVSVPQDVQQDFFHKIAATTATGLTPSHPDVLHLMTLLKMLRPSLFHSTFIKDNDVNIDVAKDDTQGESLAQATARNSEHGTPKKRPRRKSTRSPVSVKDADLYKVFTFQSDSDFRRCLWR